MKSHRLAVLVIPASAAIWGLYWLPLREMEQAGVAGGWVMVLFSLPALVGAFIVAMLSGGPRTANTRLLAMAGLLAGLAMAFYGLSLIMTSVIRATMLFYLTPIWGTALGVIMLGERPGLLRWLGLVAALIGLVLILGVGAGDFVAGFGIGEVFGLASGLLWAIAATLIRRGGTVGPGLTLWQYVGLIGGGAIAAIALGDPAPSPETAMAAFSPFVLLMSGLILASFYALNWGIAQVSPGRSGVLMMSEVIVAVLSAAILLPNEVLSAPEWLGVLLLIGAGVLEATGSEPQELRPRTE